MTSDQSRWIFIIIFVSAFSISGYFRHQARKTGGVIPRAREGKVTFAMRLVFAAPLYLSIIAYMVGPSWMAWSSMPTPTWLRWTAAGIGFGMLPLLVWVLRSLGPNISETFLTKETHALVMHGPYRWVRHPLYAVATTAFIALAILAANWFMLLMAILALSGLVVAVIPREEAELIRRFGRRYLEYMERTGKLTPRLKSDGAPETGNA